MKYSILFLALFFICCDAHETQRIQGKEDVLFGVDNDDPEMNKAIEDARKTIGRFNKALNSGDTSLEFFALKVRFPLETGAEHIWFREISFKNNSYTGIVNNEPEEVKSIKVDDTLTINSNDITDWMYLKNNKLVGGYTTRLLLKRMTPEERKEFDSTNFYIVE